MTELEILETEIKAAIEEAADQNALEAVRVSSLGKKGSVSLLMKSLGGMSPEERKEMGPRLNGLKQIVADAIAARAGDLKSQVLEARLAQEKIDVTLPVRPQSVGSIHPVSQVWDEVVQIFADLGFSVALSIFIGLGIGVWLDRFIFNTTPWLTLIFLGLGIAAGFRNIGLAIKKARKF